MVSGSGDCTARIWDSDTNTPYKTLTGHTGWVLAVAYSPVSWQHTPHNLPHFSHWNARHSLTCMVTGRCNNSNRLPRPQCSSLLLHRHTSPIRQTPKRPHRLHNLSSLGTLPPQHSPTPPRLSKQRRHSPHLGHNPRHRRHPPHPPHINSLLRPLGRQRLRRNLHRIPRQDRQSLGPPHRRLTQKPRRPRPLGKPPSTILRPRPPHKFLRPQ